MCCYETSQALDYDKVEVVADYEKQKEEVVKRIQEWQHNHAAKTKAGKKRKKSKKEDAGGQTESSGTDGKTDQIDQHTPKKPKVLYRIHKSVVTWNDRLDIFDNLLLLLNDYNVLLLNDYNVDV